MKRKTTLPAFDTFGIELEFHVSDAEGSVDTAGLGDKLNGNISDFGEVDSDAGIGLAEIITHTFGSVKEAVGAVDSILAALPAEWNKDFTVYRPERLGPAQWAQKPRYDALKKAAQTERPESWQLINQMTGLASVHLNMSGPGFDPLDPEGQLVMNMMRNASPFIASKVHKYLGYGAGHLSLWDFADKRRMPDYNRWHPDFPSFSAEFAQKGRFVGEADVGSDVWKALPTGSCSVYDRVDLGTYWDFARPKLKANGKSHYLELRMLPSMPTEEIFRYATALHSICELIVSWHQREMRSEPLSREAAAPAFAHVASFYGDFFPAEPLDETTWSRLLLE